MVLVRITRECSLTFDRYTLHLVDERARRLHFIGQGYTRRDLNKFGISARRDVDGLRIAESVDLNICMPSDERARAAIVAAQAHAHRETGYMPV